MSYNEFLRATSQNPSYNESLELLSEVQSVLVQASQPEIITVRSEILTAILAAKVLIKEIHRLDTSMQQTLEQVKKD